MEIICNEKKCTACLACINKCHKGAINLKTDKFGRNIAVIDKDKCVDCGACKQVCPNNRNVFFNSSIACYAARTKNNEIKEICSSGGVATTIGEYIIKNNGIYFGATYFPTEIVQCRSVNEVRNTSGSKYIESNTSNSYSEVYSELKKGKFVVYSGTPCQIAGLISFLGGEQEKLLTIDLVCHGMPPVEYLEYYLSCKKIQADNISFRKKDAWRLQAFVKNKVVWETDSYLDAYYNMFMDGMIFRENCYECPYAQEKRVSDLTIGDFWGIQKENLKYAYDGNISLILINTEKGKAFFGKIKNLFTYENRPIEEAIKGNDQLRHPSERNEYRRQFERLVYRKGWKFALNYNKIANDKRKIRIVNKIKKIIRQK